MKTNSVMVLARCNPTAKQLPDAMKVYEEFCALVAKQCSETHIELLCGIEGQLAWIEEWPSKTALKQFYDNYAGFSDLPLRLMQASRGVPTRYHFQPVSDNLK